ncbi:hypothetical protein R3P38DRAFT_2617291 [Favolaschia claudopus]|uniref:J domain-containing protein n=1 Tax=Favolaschia claudopus TaxID=2862362 RepID=A0AAW0C6P0_9AGAR
MVAWSSLGACRNPDCPFKGSCGTFFPECGLDALDAVASALGIKCICACFGVQHVAPVTTPNPSSSSSASAPEALNSRAARQQESDSSSSRKEKQQTELKAHIFQFAFDPSKQSQAKNWSKLSDRPQKRKPSSTNPSGEPSSKRSASSTASATKLVIFTLVLVENPALVEANEYFMPSGPKMMSLYRAGNIQIIEVPLSITPDALDVAVNAAFADHSDVVSGRVSLYKWRSLSKVSVSRGAHPLLKPHREAGQVTFQDFEWSNETHRQEKRFKRCVFISLARWNSSIPLDIDEPREGGSESSGPSDAEPMDEVPERDPSPDFPEPGDLLSDDNKPDESTFNELSSSIHDVVRLCLNITKPEIETPWFPSTVSEPYTQPLQVLANIIRQLERMESPTESSSWTPRHLFDFAQDSLFPLLAVVVDFGESESMFDTQFRLGPFGLGLIIEFFQRIYTLVMNWMPRLPYVELSGFVSVINTFVVPIYDGVLRFRAATPRIAFDPEPFAKLRETLQKHRHRFGDADFEDRLAVLDLLVTRDDVPVFANTLEADFGSATSSTAIRPAALLVGAHGIDGFIEKIIDPLLDTMPSTHPSYRPLMALLGNFCNELSRRMINFSKDGSESSEKRYKTRSKTAHYTRSGNPLFYFSESQSSSSESESFECDSTEYDGKNDDTQSEPSVFEYDPSSSDREQFNRSNPFAERPKFPYPEAHTQHEQPFDIPREPSPPTASSSTAGSSSQSSRPRPRPTYQGTGFTPHSRPQRSTPSPASQHVSNPTLNAIWAMPSDSWMSEILTRFPHPMEQRRRTWAQISNASAGNMRKYWLKVSMIYHPDKNADMPQDWQDLCDAITKRLNGKFS